MEGYEALREHAAWLDLSARGRVRLTGDDRVRLVHALTTNHIEQLKAGEGCYAFFLNAQGRILADAVILAIPDSLLVNTEPETRKSLYEHIDKYIIADDVTPEDITDETAQIGVEGPLAEEMLRKLGAPVPEASCSHAAWGERGTLVRFSTTGQPGFSIIVPASDKDKLIRELEAAGAQTGDEQAARTVRIESGRPRYGEDMTDRYLPHETQVLAAVHFNKGCYLGQEIVERVRSRGGVHRFLVPLEIETNVAPPPGTRVLADGKELGEITSAVFCPTRGKVAGLGYVRMDQVPTGTVLTADGRPVVVTARTPKMPA